jgi:hypothetical protein
VVACQLGVMFFPDKLQGYREAHRTLRPRGQFLFNVWDRISANDSPMRQRSGLWRSCACACRDAGLAVGTLWLQSDPRPSPAARNLWRPAAPASCKHRRARLRPHSRQSRCTTRKQVASKATHLLTPQEQIVPFPELEMRSAVMRAAKVATSLRKWTFRSPIVVSGRPLLVSSIQSRQLAYHGVLGVGCWVRARPDGS